MSKYHLAVDTPKGKLWVTDVSKHGDYGFTRSPDPDMGWETREGAEKAKARMAVQSDLVKILQTK